MDHAEVLAAYDRQVRRGGDGDGPGVRIEEVSGVVRRTGTADDWNGVLWSDLDADTADAAIAEQVRHFSSLGLEFEWKLYAHDRPHDLGARLRAAGLVPEEDETLMVAETAGQTADAAPPEGVRLVPVTDAAGVELMVRLHDTVFGGDSSRLGKELLTRLTEAPETVVAVLAMAGDRPVSAARIEFRPGTDFAGLWGGGTLKEWRGRGVYRALVAHRARIAAERGVRYLQVDASDDSRPILERLGFAPLTVTTPYICAPGSTATVS